MTEVEYREVRYLRCQDQKRERQAQISRIEALDEEIEREERLADAERLRLRAIIESREVWLFQA